MMFSWGSDFIKTIRYAAQFKPPGIVSDKA